MQVLGAQSQYGRDGVVAGFGRDVKVPVYKQVGKQCGSNAATMMLESSDRYYVEAPNGEVVREAAWFSKLERFSGLSRELLRKLEELLQAVQRRRHVFYTSLAGQLWGRLV